MQGLNKSVVMKYKFIFLKEQAEKVKELPGDVAEIGVYKGGTAKLLASTLPEKNIHLFDTFEGMPEVTEWDKHRKGDFSDTSLEEVRDYLKDCLNVRFYPGLFPETANLVKENSFCLVHVDVDIYESTKAALEFFWTRLVPGGIMVFDDYNVKTCPGTDKAVNEFFSALGLSVTPAKRGVSGTFIVK